MPIDTLLTQFAAALYVDDRVPNAARRLTMTSWNLYDIENGENPLARLTPHEHNFGVYSDQVTVRGDGCVLPRERQRYPSTGIKVLGPNGSLLPNHMRLWYCGLQ